MLTNFVYLIQVKNRKTPGACSGVIFLLHGSIIPYNFALLWITQKKGLIACKEGEGKINI